MGQQQLLLLVLATVIVGLATVAGIRAFDEGQTQATQDALVQRAMSLGNDLYAAHNKANQVGGITIGESDQDVASAIGVSDASDIPADGAGESAQCEVTGVDSAPATINCGEDGVDGGDVTVTVEVSPDEDDPVEVTDLSINS